ncbi:MAG: tRNA lysidine(34) synthetase TilS [Butyrivibrio sp.]|nr:tRNA lysidine(34) synthetase TilS [Butyrivibrio sp.]
MNSFENKVLNFINEKNMIPKGSRILVGLSGGADSTALLLVLNALKKLLDIEITAVHINHRIRLEAGEDAQFSEKLCKRLDIQCFVIEKDIPKLSVQWNMTEEEAGRKARYDAFNEVSKKENAQLIAVAHHQNDVAETILMNLLRGSGLHGAAGIRPVRDNIIRPLLCVSRKEIEEYLNKLGQDYCHDKTNDENIHTRNIIRNVLIPVMEKEINKGAVEHLYKVAADFSKADDYIRLVASTVYEEVVTCSKDTISFNLVRYKKEEEIIKKEIILKAFEDLTPSRKDISSAHINAVYRLCENENGTASLDLPYGITAIRSYETLELTKKDHCDINSERKDFPIPAALKSGEKISFFIPKLGLTEIEVFEYNGGKLFPTSPYTKWFDYDRIQEAIFRKRCDDDYIMIEQSGHLNRKKVNKLMTDAKIPRNERDNIYLLADGNNVLWVPGYRMSGAFKVSETTKEILAINIDNGGNNNG